MIAQLNDPIKFAALGRQKEILVYRKSGSVVSVVTDMHIIAARSHDNNHNNPIIVHLGHTHTHTHIYVYIYIYV